MQTNCALSCALCTPAREPWKIDYKRSFDYLAIVNRQNTGVWSVPIAFGAVLIRANLLPSILQNINTTDAPTNTWATGTLLAHAIRRAGFQIYVTNLLHFGNLIDDTDYPEGKVHPDLYMIENNLPEWKEYYLHPDYYTWRQLGMANDSLDGHVCNQVLNEHFDNLSLLRYVPIFTCFRC